MSWDRLVEDCRSAMAVEFCKKWMPVVGLTLETVSQAELRIRLLRRFLPTDLQIPDTTPVKLLMEVFVWCNRERLLAVLAEISSLAISPVLDVSMAGPVSVPASDPRAPGAGKRSRRNSNVLGLLPPPPLMIGASRPSAEVDVSDDVPVSKGELRAALAAFLSDIQRVIPATAGPVTVAPVLSVPPVTPVKAPAASTPHYPFESHLASAGLPAAVWQAVLGSDIADGGSHPVLCAIRSFARVRNSMLAVFNSMNVPLEQIESMPGVNAALDQLLRDVICLAHRPRGSLVPMSIASARAVEAIFEGCTAPLDKAGRGAAFMGIYTQPGQAADWQSRGRSRSRSHSRGRDGEYKQYPAWQSSYGGHRPHRYGDSSHGRDGGGGSAGGRRGRGGRF